MPSASTSSRLKNQGSNFFRPSECFLTAYIDEQGRIKIILLMNNDGAKPNNYIDHKKSALHNTIRTFYHHIVLRRFTRESLTEVDQCFEVCIHKADE